MISVTAKEISKALPQCSLGLIEESQKSSEVPSFYLVGTDLRLQEIAGVFSVALTE
jgi:hypothetical protein